MGRRAWNPTDEQRRIVERAALYGFTQEQIGQILGVSDRAIRRHCQDEFRSGALKATMEVAETLYRLALGGHVGACCFILKTRAGWRETVKVEPEIDRALETIKRVVIDAANSDGEGIPPAA